MNSPRGLILRQILALLMVCKGSERPDIRDAAEQMIGELIETMQRRVIMSRRPDAPREGWPGSAPPFQ